jgi:hypothetical protein
VAGRFPLYTDADVQGQCIKALKQAGWDVLRAIDAFPEKTKDLPHFERAVALGRVLVSNDDDQRQVARQWYKNKKPFPGVIWWPQPQYQLMRPSDVVSRFEEYAAQDDPFARYPILDLKPPKS